MYVVKIVVTKCIIVQQSIVPYMYAFVANSCQGQGQHHHLGKNHELGKMPNTEMLPEHLDPSCHGDLHSYRDTCATQLFIICHVLVGFWGQG